MWRVGPQRNASYPSNRERNRAGDRGVLVGKKKKEKKGNEDIGKYLKREKLEGVANSPSISKGDERMEEVGDK